MNRRKITRAMLAGLFILFFSVPAYSDEYTPNDIEIPGAEFSWANDMNDSGHVAGVFDDAQGSHGFVFDGQTVRTVDYPGADNTRIEGINNAGTLVGNAFGPDWNRAFRWEGENPEDLEYPGSDFTSLTGINNLGHVVGNAWVGDGWIGFVADGADYTPVTYPGDFITQVQGINDHGTVVGNAWAPDWSRVEHAFYWDGGNFHDLEAPEAKTLEAFGINNEGEICGTYTAASEPEDVTPTQTGFIYHSFTSVTLVGAKHLWINAINNNRQFSGAYKPVSTNIARAFWVNLVEEALDLYYSASEWCFISAMPVGDNTVLKEQGLK